MPHQYSKILVTGGMGFIGSHIVDRLLNEDFEVTVIDNLFTGRLRNLNRYRDRKDFHFIKGDIRNFDLVKKVLKDVDAVFHEAALVSLLLSVEDPISTNEINVTGTLDLLQASLKSGVKRFIYASSASVYGVPTNLPIKEDMIKKPISPYAVSKLAAENYARTFYEVHGLETVCLRYFNVYGPRQIYGPYSGVITVFINRLLRDQPPIIYGDGKQSRDFIYVRDVVDANMFALNRKNVAGEVFNIASGSAITINYLAKTLSQIMGKAYLKPLYDDPRPGDIKGGYADVDKARRVLGFIAKTPLEKGLSEFIAHAANAS